MQRACTLVPVAAICSWTLSVTTNETVPSDQTGNSSCHPANNIINTGGWGVGLYVIELRVWERRGPCNVEDRYESQCALGWREQ